VAHAPQVIAGLLGMLLAAVPADGIGEELTVVSYNTHGLHGWIAGDDPARRFPIIGERLRPYDVALLQEVFLEDHYRSLGLGPETRTQGYRGNGPRPGPVGLLSWCDACGSGLAAAIDEQLTVLSVDRQPFLACAGKIRGGHDCWATKGFLYLRLRLSGGAEVDVYGLHLDAGDRGADFRTRRVQIERLRREIGERSSERALIVAGDFNLAEDRKRDRDLLEGFARDLGLVHSGARPQSTRWRVLDYIFYRSGPRADFRLVAAGQAMEFVDDQQRDLSDHPALFARFDVEKR
jgi:endonuclease/exonuclease/phosphatase family metal-dependent hydrolase